MPSNPGEGIFSFGGGYAGGSTPVTPWPRPVSGRKHRESREQKHLWLDCVKGYYEILRRITAKTPIGCRFDVAMTGRLGFELRPSRGAKATTKSVVIEIDEE